MVRYDIFLHEIRHRRWATFFPPRNQSRLFQPVHPTLATFQGSMAWSKTGDQSAVEKCLGMLRPILVGMIRYSSTCKD